MLCVPPFWCAAGRMYAFVNFRNPEEAKRAVATLNDREVGAAWVWLLTVAQDRCTGMAAHMHAHTGAARVCARCLPPPCQLVYLSWAPLHSPASKPVLPLIYAPFTPPDLCPIHTHTHPSQTRACQPSALCPTIPHPLSPSQCTDHPHRCRHSRAAQAGLHGTSAMQARGLTQALTVTPRRCRPYPGSASW